MHEEARRLTVYADHAVLVPDPSVAPTDESGPPTRNRVDSALSRDVRADARRGGRVLPVAQGGHSRAGRPKCPKQAKGAAAGGASEACFVQELGGRPTLGQVNSVNLPSTARGTHDPHGLFLLARVIRDRSLDFV